MSQAVVAAMVQYQAALTAEAQAGQAVTVAQQNVAASADRVAFVTAQAAAQAAQLVNDQARYTAAQTATAAALANLAAVSGDAAG
jgi:hypothetical protein